MKPQVFAVISLETNNNHVVIHFLALLYIWLGFGSASLLGGDFCGSFHVCV